MKNFFIKYHNKIDFIASYLLMYFISVKLLIIFTSWIHNEQIRVAIVMTIPFILIKAKSVNKFNDLIHRICGFIR